MVSIAQVRKRIVQSLRAADIDASEAGCEAGIILEHVTGRSGAAQILHADDELSATECQQIDRILLARSKRVPLQYCLGYGWFLDMKLRVQPGVFIPRSDTETLVLVVEDWLRRGVFGGARCRLSDVSLAEIGIGSGAISIALLRRHPELRIFACDVSDRAVAVAAENARSYAVADRLTIAQGDWRDVLPRKLQAIISNPPYIPLYQARSLQAEVANHEPSEALFGSHDDGLGFYRELSTAAPTHLCATGGFIAVEVGDNQADLVRGILAETGWEQCLAHCDMNKLPRVISAQRS